MLTFTAVTSTETHTKKIVKGLKFAKAGRCGVAAVAGTLKKVQVGRQRREAE